MQKQSEPKPGGGTDLRHIKKEDTKMRKTTFFKGQARITMEPTAQGKVIITSEYYLTAYQAWGAKVTQTVPLETAEETYKRLIRKGYRIA